MSANTVNRIGLVSSVNYEAGTVRVTYPDRDDSVTGEIPLLSPIADEYFMPKVDDQVLVCHLSNGTEYGVVLGRPWDEEHKPAESGEGLYRKDFDREAGKAYLRYDANSGELKIKAKKIVFEGDESVATNTKTMTANASASATVTAPAIKDDGEVTITKNVTAQQNVNVSLTMTATVDAVGGGKSLKGHTHTGNLGTPTSPPL